MKLCIFGSRNFHDYQLLKEKVDAIHSRSAIKEVVSGQAKGADLLGEKWAKENQIKIVPYPADWDKYGKSAGYIRNREMAEYCDKAIGFIVDNSKGSEMMCKCLREFGKTGWKVEITSATETNN